LSGGSPLPASPLTGEDDRESVLIRRRPQDARLFTALEIPEELTAKLVALKCAFPDAHWTAPANLHVTIRFIGQVPQERVEIVRQSLRAVRSGAFRLSLSGLGLFSCGDGGILWAGVQGTPALRELGRQVDEALRSGPGLDVQDGPFSPHCTLSRIKKPVSEAFRNRVQANAATHFGEFPVAAFTLFRSFLRPSGAVHEPVETYPLSKEEC
jgi:2'-5' RNA ligase